MNNLSHNNGIVYYHDHVNKKLSCTIHDIYRVICRAWWYQ